MKDGRLDRSLIAQSLSQIHAFFSQCSVNAPVLGGIKGRFIMSLNAVPGIYETFEAFRIEEVDCTYSVGGGGNSKAVKEVIISTAVKG